MVRLACSNACWTFYRFSSRLPMQSSQHHIKSTYHITIHVQYIQNIPSRGAWKRFSYKRFLVSVFYHLFILIFLFVFFTLYISFLIYFFSSHVGMNGSIEDPRTFMVLFGWHMHQIWTPYIGKISCSWSCKTKFWHICYSLESSWYTLVNVWVT